MSGTANDDNLSSSFLYSEFTPVKSKKKRLNKFLKEQLSPLQQFQRVRDDLVNDTWFTQCQQILDTTLNSSISSPNVLCLGLGSPATSHNARVQLAFLTELCDRLNIERDRVSVYDPIFTAEDLSLINELQIRALSENRSGDYPLEDPTLCFMPHCDMELYESLLRANWSRERLSRLFLLANRLEEYVDTNPRHKLEMKVPYLLRIAPKLACQELPVSKAWPAAFNNTSLQYLELHTVLPDDWFTGSPELKGINS
ncbi:SRR1-domain-containing protein [Cyathus striatus]|nr:SRR1-domain-containing protein [Cyathus striatus]